jgi:predicted PurR-regulated permease PerM
MISALITVSAASAAILYLLFFAARNLMAELSSLGRLSTYFAEPNLEYAIRIFLSKIFPNLTISLLDGIPSTVASYLIDLSKASISMFISDLPVYIAQLILLVFFTYYFFIDGKDIIMNFIELLPEKKVVNYFFNELNLIYNIFFRIHFFIAVIDGIIGAIGFYVLGIPFPFTWASYLDSSISSPSLALPRFLYPCQFIISSLMTTIGHWKYLSLARSFLASSQNMYSVPALSL